MKKCKFEECNRDHAAKGYCKVHWAQLKMGKKLTPIIRIVRGRIGCKFKDCKNIHFAKGYCHKHYCQKKYHGIVRGRSMQDPNEFIEKKDCYEIVLYHVDGSQRKERAIIDKNDYNKCKNYRWGVSSKRCKYVQNRKAGRLHHHVWGKMVGLDHIDRNELDCRKSNLREATIQENAFNRGLRSDNASGFTGVYWNKECNKWRVQIFVNKKSKHLGLFANKNDAKDAYNQAVIKYRKEFGRINP